MKENKLEIGHKPSLIEEWKNIKMLTLLHPSILSRGEKAQMQKRYLELNRILLSEYN